MHPRKSRFEAMFGLMLSAILGIALLQASGTASAQTRADLYIKDTPSDAGVEPNPDPGPMWVAEDIWVRTTPDPGYQPAPFPEASPPWPPLLHENPEYRDPKFSVPNYVYVRVRNRGSSASSGTERLKLYWAKAATGLAWPTQWVDYLPSGSTHLYGAEVTKPRKNAASSETTPAELAAYRQAVLDVGTAPLLQFADGISYWHKQDVVHELGPSNRHGSPAFLPWHREFINRYEVLLQEANPTVKLLYWDWTTDPENSTNGFNFFTPNFMGASGRGTGGASIGLPFLPSLSPPAITRNLDLSTTPPADSDSAILGTGAYQLFAPALESCPNHDCAHGYIGGGGNMSSINRAAEDPFFFLLHTNVDRLWAQWQRDPSNVSRLAPATAYDSNSANANITTMMRPWDGTGTSIRPWTVTDGYIVSKSPTNPSVVSPPIYDTAPLRIPVLQPGEAVVLEIPWYPPNPADFASFGGDQGHFCLLARIETTTSYPFGMTFPESADVSANTRNNNNIAWKNVTVVDNFPGALRLTSILIRNVFKERVLTGLRFANAEEIGASFFDSGRILVDLKPELFKRWQEGGAVGRGIEPLGEGAIQIVSPEAFLGNIALEPEEVFSVDLRFELSKEYKPPRGRLPKWDLMQLGTPEKPDAVVGGQRFELDFSKLVLVRAGDDWRYRDDGFAQEADWVSPDWDDSGWKLGRAALGFGDDVVTTIDGGPPDQRHITTYFRKSFDVADPGFFRSLYLRLRRNDGAVVYLNGKEIQRVNLPEGEITPKTFATRQVDGLERQVFFPIPVERELLQQGRNVLAVEIHLASPDSPDLSFDLELYGNPANPRFPPTAAFVTPMDGALFQPGQAIPIEVEALDGDGKVRAVSLFADGEPVGTREEPPYVFEWNFAEPGTHRLRAAAVDDDDQRATVEVALTVLENVPPVVALTQPMDGAVFASAEAIAAVAQASDAMGKVDRVEFYLRDAEIFGAKERLAGTVTEEPYLLVLTAPEPGHYMLTAIAFDDRGDRSQSMPVHIEITGEHHPR